MIVIVFLAGLILASAVLAMSLRNLIHSALLLILTWAGVAGFYLWAGAEFIAFGQVLIYVGAVSMVVLFAVLLTQRTNLSSSNLAGSRRRAAAAIFGGAAVAAVLVAAVISTPFDPADPASAAPRITVLELGKQLMETHVAALLVVGVILTVALIGATILASSDPSEARHRGPASAFPGAANPTALTGHRPVAGATNFPPKQAPLE